MDFSPDPSVTTLDSAKEEGTSESKMRTAFKKTEHKHRWLLSHLTFSDKFEALYSDFASGEVRVVNYNYYRSEVVIISAAWWIKSNCGTQYIQVGGIVPEKLEDQKSYQEELEGQLGVMCTTKIMEYILVSTTRVVNSFINISDLRRVTIHPEAVK